MLSERDLESDLSKIDSLFDSDFDIETDRDMLRDCDLLWDWLTDADAAATSSGSGLPIAQLPKSTMLSPVKNIAGLPTLQLPKCIVNVAITVSC